MRGLPGRPDSTATLFGGAVALLGANLLPLVGVVAWGWDLTALLVAYWTEAFSTVVLAAVKALFAERGSPGIPGQIEPLHGLREKRGGWQFRPTWPPLYPRNLPFALSILGFWLVTVVPLSVLYWFSADLTLVLTLDLALGIGALVIAQGSDFVFEYIGNGEYADVSAQEIVRTPAQLSLVVVSVGLLAAAESRASGLLILALVVAAKTTVSMYQFYVEHVGTPILRLRERLFDDGTDSEPPPELDLPNADVSGRVTADARAVLLGSVGAIAFGFVNRVGFLTLVFLVLAIVAGDFLWLAVALLAVLVLASARVLSYFLRYGTVEYQRRGDDLVAYDTALEAPQWIASVDSGADFAVRNAIADRLLGTGTLTIADVESVDRDVRLGPVSDIDRAVARLDLPVQQTERPERDPAVIAAASVLLLFFLAVPAGLFLTPDVSDALAWGLSLVFAPFFLLPVGALAWAALSRV
ncbi:DUF6498-containing protein [Halobellus sp. H-GB7]|uniref:DUF6498-containing protein n=1 Tax=Halobellus sp. H-GB7 TaxID=3069756 RepID=UPI0027AFBCF3|nr:DUF6498-containing protein [Halobellus sp. H-GB7]MDQ2054681.1 DUF6498-containing protein [Halobellus sp. H-GB7]